MTIIEEKPTYYTLFDKWNQLKNYRSKYPTQNHES